MAYDLEMPRGLQPLCSDGEVEQFRLLPMGEVLAAIEANSHPEPTEELSEGPATPSSHPPFLSRALTTPLQSPSAMLSLPSWLYSDSVAHCPM